MAYIDLGPPRKEYKASTLYRLFALIEKGLNYLDNTNFPHGLGGGVINDRTLRGSALVDWDVPLSKLKWVEFSIPLILPAEQVNTTSTTGKDLGGYFAWNPNAYRDSGKWFLEASIAISNEEGTAICILKGSQEWGQVETQETKLTLVRSESIAMPPGPENLWIVLKTSNSSYAASLGAARLIFIPGI